MKALFSSFALLFFFLFITFITTLDGYGQCGAPTIGGNENEMCEGESRNFDLLGVPGGATVYWKKDGVVFTQTSGSVTITGPGVYRAYYVSGGCTSPDSDPKTVPPRSNCGGGCTSSTPTVNANPTSACSGVSISLTAGGCDNGTLTWLHNGATGTSTTATGPGTYTVKCKQGSCSETNNSVTVSAGSGCSGGGNNNSDLGTYVGINMSNLGQNLAGIGSFNLAVNGKIIAKEVRVKTGWADYVFEPTYQLRPLSSLSMYIQRNGHLPDVPSATEVERDGIQLGEANAILLRKIEELTLYILQQDKRIRQLEQAQRKRKKP